MGRNTSLKAHGSAARPSVLFCPSEPPLNHKIPFLPPEDGIDCHKYGTGTGQLKKLGKANRMENELLDGLLLPSLWPFEKRRLSKIGKVEVFQKAKQFSDHKHDKPLPFGHSQHFII
jgi:hypothetical protein